MSILRLGWCFVGGGDVLCRRTHARTVVWEKASCWKEEEELDLEEWTLLVGEARVCCGRLGSIGCGRSRRRSRKGRREGCSSSNSSSSDNKT